MGVLRLTSAVCVNKVSDLVRVLDEIEAIVRGIDLHPVDPNSLIALRQEFKDFVPSIGREVRAEDYGR